MHRTIRHLPWRAVALAATLSLAAFGLGACGEDEPAGSEKSQGGENTLDRAGKKIDRAHRNFQRAVDPAADWVDEKTKKAAGEGKKAVRKTADAIDETVDGE